LVRVINGDQTVWQRWMRQPQTTWLRRALFQVHMWTGVAVGLYIVVVTVSGSLLVFKAGVNALFVPATIVPVSGPRMTEEQLREAIGGRYQQFTVAEIEMPSRADRAAEVTLVSGRYKQFRLLDPYTGADLGLAGDETPFILWLVELHDNLFGGETGRKVNGAGAVALIVMCLTGLVIWWPGVSSWRRGLMIKRGVSWKRFNFDLHSMAGIWAVAFLLLWAVTGAYFAFPETYQAVADYFEPPELLEPTETAFNEVLFAQFVRLHFGRNLGDPAYSTLISWVWVVVGLAPAVLLTTGAIMWWQRVIRKRPVK
jgi:uncharacterized iron-regulated membrane protein